MSDIIFQSTYENVCNFIKEVDLLKLIKLSLYISGSESLDRPPTEFEKGFIKEFFTHEGWANFMQQRKNPNKLFKKIPPFDFQGICGMLNFEINKLSQTEIKQLRRDKNKVEKEKGIIKQVKIDLDKAIVGSYDRGIVYKDDLWINTSEVLEKHNLIDPDKYE